MRRLAVSTGIALLVSVACVACGDSEETSDEPVPDLAGVLDVSGTPLAIFSVHVAGDEALAIDFNGVGNPQLFDAGDPFLKNITPLDEGRWRAQVAVIDLGTSPDGFSRWPASLEYVDVELTWDTGKGRFVTNQDPAVELSPKDGETFDGDYDVTGACETKLQNYQDETLYLCDYPESASSCGRSDPDYLQHFWPKASCHQLGYSYLDEGLGNFRFSEESNVTPGAHGRWGDQTGGTPDGGGGILASCTDANACIEILTSPPVSDEDAIAAFQQECSADPGTTFAAGGCPGPKGPPAPTCMNATIVSAGISLRANVYWHPSFCEDTGQTIDTRTTCELDLGDNAEPTGVHCRE